MTNDIKPRFAPRDIVKESAEISSILSTLYKGTRVELFEYLPRPNCPRCHAPVTNFIIIVEDTTYKMEAECLEKEKKYACSYEFYRVNRDDFDLTKVVGLAPEYDHYK